MSISTFTELKAAIADWLLRDDLTAVIPSFIALAEADLNRNVRHWRMEARTTITLDAQYEELPSNYLEAKRLSITSGDTYRLELISQAEMETLRASSVNVTGRPLYYAVTAGQLEFFPTPADSYTLEIVYVTSLTALADAAGGANWLLTHYPDVYLYGSLMHAAPYLSDDDRINVWAQLYAQAVAGVNAESNKAKFSGAGMRLKINSY